MNRIVLPIPEVKATLSQRIAMIGILSLISWMLVIGIVKLLHH